MGPTGRSSGKRLEVVGQVCAPHRATDWMACIWRGGVCARSPHQGRRVGLLSASFLWDIRATRPVSVSLAKQFTWRGLGCFCMAQ